MNNNRGFTLVEVLASILILSILATVFFQIFIFSQKTTTGNQEKLVAINVAQGVLERFKQQDNPTKSDDDVYFYTEVTRDSETAILYPKTYTNLNCGIFSIGTKNICEDRYKIKVNDKFYIVEIEVGQKVETELNLRHVKVMVYDEDRKPLSSVKGFVEI